MYYSIKQLKGKFWELCSHQFRFRATRFHILDKMALKLYWAPRLYKSLISIKNISEGQLYKTWHNSVYEFINGFHEIPDNSNIFLSYPPGGAGDYAYAFPYIREIIKFLENKNCKIFLIGHKKFKDIVKMYIKYFNITLLLIDSPGYNIHNIEDLPKNLEYLKNIIQDNKGLFIDLRDPWPDSSKIFLKTNGKMGGLYNNMHIFKKGFYNLCKYD